MHGLLRRRGQGSAFLRGYVDGARERGAQAATAQPPSDPARG